MILKRLTVLLLLLAISSSVHAQRFNQKRVYEGMRDGTWEATLMIGSQGSLDAEGQNGSGVSIDSEIAWGFSIGWNWTERWNFNYRFTLAKPDYMATIVPQDPDIPNQTLDYSADRYANQLNAIWHWFKGPLTPYLQAGIGYTKLDSNVPSRPPDIDCWWDPWWGYICF